MTNIYNLLYRINQSKHIGNVSDAYEFCLLRKEGLQHIESETSVVIDRKHSQYSFLPPAKQLPWNDIGMMLGFGNDYLVALTYERFTERICHKIDGSCGT